MSVVFLFRSLRASSMFTTGHQLGLSTRKALRCIWTRCVLLQQHSLHPSRYLATTSCRSCLHSSFSLRPACSLGDLWRVRAFRTSGKKVDMVLLFPILWLSHIASGLWVQLSLARKYLVLYLTARHFLMVISRSRWYFVLNTNPTKLEQYHIFSLSGLHC